MAADVDRPITRSDIEAKLRQIKDEVDTTTETAKPYAAVAAVAMAVVVVGLAFFLGRRKGRKGTTLVEIRKL